MLEQRMTAEKAQQKRLIYLKTVYAIAIGLSLFYIIKFNFIYHVSEYNPELLTLWLGLGVLCPLCLYGLKNYFYAALSACFLSTALLDYFLYVSGGADAPGLFWLAIVPVMFAILLKVRGAVVGYFLVTITLLYFWYLKSLGVGPNIIADHGNYSFEKNLNLTTFLFLSCFTIHLYISSEARFVRKMKKQNSDVENLLHILLHDIANTLSSMTYNMVKAREDNEMNSPAKEFDKIESAVEEINNILQQVRHLKSIKDGKAEMPMKPVSLAMALQEVFEQAEALATSKGIKLALDLSREKMMIRGEKTILSKVVLMNLISNAVKFSYAGDRIDLRAYPQNSMAVIEIQDYGIGMPTELQRQLFSLSARTTREGTQGEKGTGYGMPLVKEYLQMMGGSIQIDSQEGASSRGGTKVTLKLPLV